MVDKAREVALKVLYKIEENQAYSNIALNEELSKNREKLTEKDIGLISEIVYGVITWKLTIDEIIKKHSKIKIKKISKWILNILRMGIYQIIFLDKIPKSAAVDECVNLAKKYGHKSSANYTNAILRNVDEGDYEELNEIESKIERISKVNSVPEWIIEELLKNNSIETVEQICKNFNVRPQITARINALKISKEELIKKLEESKVFYKETEHKDFFVLQKIKNLENMELFKKGYFTIQDISAGMAVNFLEPKAGERILDACAAPGGKTTYIAEMMRNSGKIDAWDIYKHRTDLIEENAKRLGITIIKTKLMDASLYYSELNEKYDRILLDVPCLGIGVIKRKPDIKWKRKKEDIVEICNIQKRILSNCSKYLKKGGILVYSTCSILKEENHKIIEEFLKQNQNFEILENGEVTILPTEIQDGFYIAKMIKK